MRTSQYLLPTLRENPSEAELVSHQLMLRSGMIRRLGSGLYTWLPMGLRVLHKVSAIIREELDKIGAQELLMPTIQPSELWQESGRWEVYGPMLLKMQDRHQREFCYGPTHEEVITDLMRRDLHSYKQLPLNCYQIQTKFRDEIRPRFGVMRAREFLMKDAYSFHIDQACLQNTYQQMYAAYTAIFSRLGLTFRAVQADSGDIGGSVSHEFQVLANSGEDLVVFCPDSDFAANIEQAEAIAIPGPTQDPLPMETIATPGQTSIEQVSEFLQISPQQTVKTLIVKGAEAPLVALVLRGDHQLNEIKAAKHPLVQQPLLFANDAEIIAYLQCPPGSIGPVNCPLPIIADLSAANLTNFVCGANQDKMHLKNVNWRRDLPMPLCADLRNVVEGDPSPDGKGSLQCARVVEVGHIFQLGKKYSEALNLTVLDENSKTQHLEMECYGIGVSRIVAAAIEQNHDDNGIVWPEPMAPFQIGIVALGLKKNLDVKTQAEKIYHELQAKGFEVLFEDRDERPGVMFANMDLQGIPHRLVISERNLKQGLVEYKARQAAEAQTIPLQQVLNFCDKEITTASRKV